jgi:hypothetical protein
MSKPELDCESDIEKDIKKDIEKNDENDDVPVDKFLMNLEGNFKTLSEIDVGEKLWIDSDEKIHGHNSYGQGFSRLFGGQGKDATADFIEKMYTVGNTLPVSKYGIMMAKAAKGVNNLVDTYNAKTWYGKHEAVVRLEKVIKDYVNPNMSLTDEECDVSDTSTTTSTTSTSSTVSAPSTPTAVSDTSSNVKRL